MAPESSEVPGKKRLTHRLAPSQIVTDAVVKGEVTEAIQGALEALKNLLSMV
jgi:hypothetical protein